MEPKQRKDIVEMCLKAQRDNPKLKKRSFYNIAVEKQIINPDKCQYQTFTRWFKLEEDLRVKKKRYSFSKKERQRICDEYWTSEQWQSVKDFCETKYSQYKMETLRRFIYEEREKEKTEFTNFVFPNYSEEEINRRLRHRSGGKYLRVETAGTLRFGVRAMEDIPMSIEEDSYICVYSDVIIDKISPQHDPAYICRSNTGLYAIVNDDNVDYGAFMNDSLNKRGNNCGLKFIKKNGKNVAVVIALRDIQEGEWCCMEYGKDYWEHYLLHYNVPINVEKTIKQFYKL
jgi:hypothetical protein